MANHYPTPQTLGIKIPFYLNTHTFEEGFLSALKGKSIQAENENSRSFIKGFEMGVIVFNEVL